MSLLLRNARLPGNDELVDVRIDNGRIGSIGYLPPGNDRAPARTVDLGERWITPGLWDNHVHFSQWSQTTRRLDVSEATSARAAADLVAERLAALAALPTAGDQDRLVGFGFRDGLWPDEPSRAILDAASGSVPVVLVSGDLHCCWLNSAALAVYGFAGHQTGVLREDDAFAVEHAIDNVPDVDLDAWADEAARAAAARGVVGIVDLEMTWNLDVWRRRIAAGTDSLRVDFGVYPHHLDEAIALGLASGQVIDDTGGLLTVGPFKVITDGSLNTRTAFCFDAYPGLTGDRDRGMLTVPTEELVTLMSRAAAAGIRPAVHAIGDNANTLALDAFEAVGCTGSIEHAQLLTAADVTRFARLGITASMQPEHAMDDRDVADRYWAGRTDRAFRLADLLAAGVQLALGSDAPVAPLDPWVAISAAVGRSRGDRAAWHPDQAISRQAALAASARGRHGIGVGQVADLAVCEIDPYTASVADLRRMPVAATLLGGRITHNTL
ncbi:amidohydrolase family protein [Cryobacterium sp. 1639]|uniref:amidohydrolase n=1 Tax=Cryobacterium inferilacus TaxID=2866629 RepID=UPI001C735FE7|nr:amidohydrolase family protein [Cryobacterium sp. 1639]MBX0298580.1 amidohydrolase family protein [Cryobacterium sp. 1639]